MSEQLRLFARSGFEGKIHIGFIGPKFEDGFIRHVALAEGLEVEVRTFGTALDQFEFPTLEWMHEWSRAAPDSPVLYVHVKGCSKPYWEWTMWRWIMNAHAITRWRESIDKLSLNNCVGYSWHATGFPASYFPGNFWWARTSFVRQLTPVQQYKSEFEQCIATKNPNRFTVRHAAECWINSRTNARPGIWGPEQSRLWDTTWWVGKDQKEACQIAYTEGR